MFALPTVRYASTTPAPPTAAPATSTTTTSTTTAPIDAPPAEVTSSGFNIDSITLDSLDLTDADIAAIPEHIGYLKSIGLDYGWGPTAMIESVLEHIHIYAGIPWWGAIAVTAVLLRVAVFPLYIKSSDMSARQMAMMPIMKPVTDRISACQKAGDTAGMQAASQEWREMRKRAGLKFTTQFVPSIVQGILGFCGFRLMRAMATLPVPALHTDGFLWLQDLTLADPYLILPAMMGLSMHLLFRLGGESGAGLDNLQPGMKRFMLYGAPVGVALLTSWQPGTLCVWFVASGFSGIVQARVLNHKAVRSFFKMAPIYKPKPGEGPMDALLKAARGESPNSRPSRTLDVPGSSRPTSQQASRSDAASMKPQYQAPNIVTRSSSRSASSNTAASQHESAGPSPSPAPGGVLVQASAAYKNMGESFNAAKHRFADAVKNGGQTSEAAKKKQFEKKALEYESAAQARAGAGRRKR